MKHKFLLIYTWFVRTILFFFPDIPIIMRFRGWLYGLGMKSCGRNFQVPNDPIIKGLAHISVGNNCVIGNGTLIFGSGELYISDEVLIGPHVIIVSGNHNSINHSFRYGKGDVGVIRIGKGSWIAGNSSVQKGASLPANSVLSANSFLNKTFDIPNSIYGGVPAKFIKNLNNVEDCR